MTTPYVTGTVSVTAGSAIVTGAGTGWQTAGLVAGVFGLDSANGNPIPVLSVDSDTQITLAKPWRGTTASGQAYWITYDTTAGQLAVLNAQRLAEYIARLDKPALAALAALTPAADKLPYFGAGGAGALTDFNAAARALLAGGVLPNAQLPNSLRAYSAFVTDLNAVLTGGWVAVGPETAGIPKPGYFGVLTIPWSDNTSATQIAYPTLGEDVAYRRHRANGVWGPWRAAGASSVGQVYNANGMPSGAIIERGSNANGEYTRFADGTQICWVTKAFDNGFQNRYWVNWAFPASFSNVETVSLNHNVDINTLVAGGNDVNSATSLWVPSFSDLSTTQALLQLTAGRSILNYQTMKTRAIAVGRWF